ncbi:MAG: four helix bundle protein [Bacteroidota bacterium]|nr:four helix bundle protein [Bacteroidota bacterium]
MQDFKKLLVWQKGHVLTKEIYLATSKFPKDELYGVTSQLRRAVLSIPTNIAEGVGRGSDADFKRFLHIAFGSASETEYLILISKELKYLSQDEAVSFDNQIIEIKKMLSSLINTLKKSDG